MNNDEENALLADGLGAALIGFAAPWQCDQLRVAVYSVEKILEILQERDGMSYEDAREFFDFNIGGAYVGEQTPIYVEDPTEEDLEMVAPETDDVDTPVFEINGRDCSHLLAPRRE